ncbi:ATP-dependent RNA helicase [Coemansia erecta]|nr:ATP-dependent RNA helicase [Coemansia sp. RSA 2618]KAJ2826197.1 ATP-dependent RNA helicase [Coemansia erecta]
MKGQTKAKARQAPQSNKRRKNSPAEVDMPATTEDAWASITLNPPPMPPLESPLSIAKADPKGSKQSAPKAEGKAKTKTKTKAKVAKRATASDATDMDTDADGEMELELSWKNVAIPTRISSADNEVGGVVSLQEIDGIDCVWEDDATTGGKVLQLRKSKASKKRKKRTRTASALANTSLANADADSADEVEDLDDINWDEFVPVDDFSDAKAERGELVSIGALMRSSEQEIIGSDHEMAGSDSEDEDHGSQAIQADDVVDPDVDVSAWEQLGLHASLLRALRHLGFTSPTEIQSKTLPDAMHGRDIIGAAETGSGKTLAFGIPMLQHISARSSAWTGPTGLVLTPTRELAIQVKDHLTAMARFNRARIVAIVGGMSQAKQERLLNSSPDIIVATPGRFWELASTNDVYLKQLQSIKFLAVDEADRMLEPGHFRELKDIFKTINEQATRVQRQTFVFSATLLKDMQLVARKLSAKAQKRNRGKPVPGSMEDLIERVGFQDEKPSFVDVTQAVATARTLVESRIDCLATEKDYNLYYFLIRYPARTLVFVNSIDSIRRMLPMLRLLGVNVFGLHAQMEQRQRLKSIDRFRDTENAVLVASDVAARGLDIPKVEYVIHYQIPRSGDLYVHRSGRTARAQNEGLAVMMVSPEERKLYYKMCAKLGKDISPFPVDLDLIGRIKPRVDLARDIELREHRLNKAAHEKNWFRKNAEELEIELDSDFMPSSDDERGAEDERSSRQEKQQIKSLKARLSQMLSKKIFSRGISGRYLSSNTISDLAERLLDQTNANANIPTLRKESALETAKLKISKKRTK